MKKYDTTGNDIFKKFYQVKTVKKFQNESIVNSCTMLSKTKIYSQNEGEKKVLVPNRGLKRKFSGPKQRVQNRIISPKTEGAKKALLP